MTHITGIKTAANVELQEVWEWGGAVSPESDPSLIPKVQHYKHFDLSDEELGRTTRYNCWGFTFLPRRYWINSEHDVDQILADNCTPVAPGSLRRGDVIRYRDAADMTTHTGRVWQVDALGNCVKVRSKWGAMAEYVHDPLDPYITPYYGTNLAYFRQIAPLKGIGDLWLRDAWDDGGEQFSRSLWASPDIVVDAPPHGSVDVNPAFAEPNRVWAVVHNRGDLDIDNVRIRYYWADPHAGFAPSNWQLIPSTPGHPNPTDPFTVPAASSAQAPYVEWTPVPVPGVADPAHQCLLAVGYVRDDPQDSSDPNPLVYPFDIQWENNVAARNVHVVSLKKGMKKKLTLAMAVPFDRVKSVESDVRFRLSYAPRLPIFGYPTSVKLPHVRVTMGERKTIDIVKKDTVAPFDRVWGPRVQPREIDYELSSGLAAAPAMKDLAAKTVAVHHMKGLRLVAGEPTPLQVEFEAPSDMPPSNFYFTIEQEVKGDVTGCYTFVLSIEH